MNFNDNSNSDINIYDATPDDAGEILEIQKLAFHGQGVLYDDMNLPPLAQTLSELIRDFNDHTYLKAMYNGKVVGSVRGRAEGDTCHISRLIVHPDHQNRGIGKRLMHAIENKFQDVRRFELYTGHKSAKNLALYAKLGYSEFARKRQRDSVILINLGKLKAGRRP